MAQLHRDIYAMRHSRNRANRFQAFNPGRLRIHATKRL